MCTGFLALPGGPGEVVLPGTELGTQELGAQQGARPEPPPGERVLEELVEGVPEVQVERGFQDQELGLGHLLGEEDQLVVLVHGAGAPSAGREEAAQVHAHHPLREVVPRGEVHHGEVPQEGLREGTGVEEAGEQCSCLAQRQPGPGSRSLG